MREFYKSISEKYRQLAKEGQISKGEAEKYARIYDFLSTCDLDDLFILFDSSAFNEIAKSYLRKAVSELITEEELEEDQARAIRNRFSLLFDEKKANEVYNN